MFAHEKVYTWIRDNIDSRRWADGSRIPTEMDLTRELQVSRDTVRKALMRLTREGYLYRKAGYGTFVKHEKSNYRLGTLDSFTEQMLERGLTPSSETVSVNCGPSKDERLREVLRVPAEESVYVVERVRKADGTPMAFETTYVPASLCPDLDFHLRTHDSLYVIYEKIYHHQMDFGRIHLEAAKCPGRVRDKLRLARNVPVLTMNCTTYLKDQRPLYHVVCHYSSEHYFFSINIPRTIQ